MFEVHSLMFRIDLASPFGLKETRMRFEGHGKVIDIRLTFGADQASVVSDRTAVFKDEDCDGHHRQAHDEHHHPHGRTVGLCRDRGRAQVTFGSGCFDSF